MNTQIGFDRCLSFINCQLQSQPQPGRYRGGERRPVITVSRQAGSGGHTVAEHLIKLLQDPGSEDPSSWAIFDRNLVERVLLDHNLPHNLARFMPEDRISEISDTMDELFGLHPPSWTLVRQTADTILHLAELGNVILIGRGANLITAKLDYSFHVRLVGSLERRVKRMQEAQQLNAKSALEVVHREDLGRKRYLKKYFNKDIDDPLLYHLVINTDLVPCGEAARMIAQTVTSRFQDSRLDSLTTECTA
jgi:cytidylate kinase